MLKNISLRYIFFHHQTTTPSLHWPQGKGCVISSFITKPQPVLYRHSLLQVALYLLSSPNHNFTSGASSRCKVALYLLSSPNHNGTRIIFSSRMVALYLLSSPNHNDWYKHFPVMELRYIFFHHQTTTLPTWVSRRRRLRYIFFHHQTTTEFGKRFTQRALRYIFFHHQTTTIKAYTKHEALLRYIFFHHQTTTSPTWGWPQKCCVISSFITKPQP